VLINVPSNTTNHLTSLPFNLITTTMSAIHEENMTNEDDEQPPRTLESYSALVKQLVPIINTVLRACR
jgi:hypothetical protein